MKPFNLRRLNRRQFVQNVGGLVTGMFGSMLTRADDLPKNTNPRAIFGDSVEPDWDKRLIITVGPEMADLVGTSDRVIQRTLIASSGNRFKLDRRLEERFHLEGDPHIASNFALLQCTSVVDVVIGNIALDGNKAHNEMIDKGALDDGSIRLDECNRITVSDVTVSDFYCDGVVWGISHDVLVENCHLYDGARLALHSGSGSQRSIVRGNRVRHCAEGIYFCWGAQHGLYEKNVIEDCTYGMTLGHSDSDNLIRDNDIRRSGEGGIHFRGGNKAFAPHRNRFERNRIVDSGGEKGVAIDINGETESVIVIKNELRETREPLSRIGILIGAETRDIRCEDNQIEGFAIPIKELRKG